MITPQFVFMVAGIASLVVAAILLIVSIAYFIRNDIRGVMDDLSGKTRSNGAVTRTRSEGRRSRRQVRKAQLTMSDQIPQGISVQEMQASSAQPTEDDLETVLDTKLQQITSDAHGVSYGIQTINDDIPTIVTSVGEYHQEELFEVRLENRDSTTALDSAEGDLPTQVETEPVAYGFQFVVTKSILAIHSQGIITAE